MRALPARRIALGALCAALLVTTTGPAALAADSHPGQEPADRPPRFSRGSRTPRLPGVTSHRSPTWSRPS